MKSKTLNEKWKKFKTSKKLYCWNSIKKSAKCKLQKAKANQKKKMTITYCQSSQKSIKRNTNLKHSNIDL